MAKNILFREKCHVFSVRNTQNFKIYPKTGLNRGLALSHHELSQIYVNRDVLKPPVASLLTYLFLAPYIFLCKLEIWKKYPSIKVSEKKIR